MGILPSARVVEEVIPIRDVDPLTCREKFKGDVDENGTCLVRMRHDLNNPDKAELQRMRYIGRGPGQRLPTI